MPVAQWEKSLNLKLGKNRYWYLDGMGDCLVVLLF